MQRIFHVLRRAASAGPREWSFRAQQAVFAARNSLAHLQGRPPFSADCHLQALRIRESDLAAWWKARRGSWFLDVECEKALTRAISQGDSQLPWVLDRAQLIVDGKMPIFSHEPVEFAHADRWHRDLILRRSAPRKVYHQIPYLDAAQVGDHKHIWEPNRFGWALWLGVAYRMTGEARYVQRFAELTDDWLDENPYPLGINYCSALEVGLRNYAWIWSLHLFSDYLGGDTALLSRLLRGVWIGCRHVQRNLSQYFSPNTHLTGEAFSLYACGAAIPEFVNAPRWRRVAAKILATEATRQFYVDGSHRELSSGYHIYSTDFYLQASLIALQTGFPLCPSIAQTAQRAAARLAELAPQDQILPPWNDCDGGRLLPLVANPLDAVPSLQAAHLLAGPQYVADEIPLRGYPLLMQPRTRSAPSGGPAKSTPALKKGNVAPLYDSGIVSYRNDEGDYLVFRASPFGYLDCPHSHDAPLGIVLHLGGQPLLVDSGTGSYTQSRQQRNQFRSAIGKNTILVGGQGPSQPGSWFQWKQTTDCQLLNFKRFPDGIRAVGQHAGFSRPPGLHVFVQREVIALDCGIIAVIDRWDADEEISVRGQFTLHPQVDVDLARKMLSTEYEDADFHFLTASLASQDAVASYQCEVPYSSNYGLVGTTRAFGYELSGSRQAVVTVFSRVGPISQLASGEIRFQEYDPVRLVITPSGLEPRRLAPAHEMNTFHQQSRS